MGTLRGTLATLLCALAWLGAAATGAQAADPFFGAFTTDLGLPAAQLEPQLDAQAATGIGVLREHVYWDRIETAPGVFDFRALDALVDRAGARGLTLLPIITGTPQFYSTRPAGQTTDGWPPRDPGSILRVAYELAHRYGRLGTYWGCLAPGLLCKRTYRPVAAWQVWNEPDFPSWWRTGPSPAGYNALLTQASLGLRLGDPFTEVVVGGLSLRALLPGGYLEQLYDQGAGLWFDTLALHPYAANVGSVARFVQRARQIADAKGDRGVPIRVSEYGFATGGAAAWTTTPDCQAALIAATTRELSARRAELGLRSITLLQWQDRPAGPRNLWPDYAGIVAPDGTAKPALAAFTDAVLGRPPALTVAGSCPAANQG